MSTYDYQDYEDLDESVYDAPKKVLGSKPPKKSWKELNKKRIRTDVDKNIKQKRRTSEKV